MIKCFITLPLFLPFSTFEFFKKLEKSKIFHRASDVVFFTFVLVRPYAVFRIWKGTFSVMKTADFWALDPPVIISWLLSSAVLDFLNVTWLIELYKGIHSYYNSFIFQLNPLPNLIGRVLAKTFF